MLGLGTRIEIGGQTENVLAPGPAIRIYECRRSALRDKPTLELCSDMSAFSHLAALGGSVSADCWLAAYSQRFDAILPARIFSHQIADDHGAGCRGSLIARC